VVVTTDISGQRTSRRQNLQLNKVTFYFSRNVNDYNVGMWMNKDLHEVLKGTHRWQVPVERISCITEQRFRVLTEHNTTGLVCVVTLEEFLMTIRFCRKMRLITRHSCELQHLHIFILHVGWDSLDLVSKEMDGKRWSYHSATSFHCPKTTLFLLPGANKKGYLRSTIDHKFSVICRKDMKYSRLQLHPALLENARA
jgi:hypothetical protein